MKIEYFLKNISLKEDDKKDIEEKLNKLERFSSQIQKARIYLSYQSNQPKEQVIHLEVNLSVPHKLLRTIEYSSNIQDAINKAERKLKRQIRKYKTLRKVKQSITRRIIRKIKR